MTKLCTKLTIILLLILSVVCVKSVNASNSDFTIDSISIKEKSGTIEVVDPILSSNTVDSNITFNNKDDAVTFNLYIRNNKRDSYKIDEITDNNQNKNISVTYNYVSDYFKSGDTILVQIIIKYKNELLNEEKVNIRDLRINLKLSSSDEEETKGEDIIINPTTGDNLLLYLVIAVLSMAAMILLIFKIEKKYKLSICAILLLFVILMVIPFIMRFTKSLEVNECDIIFDDIVVVGRYEEFNVEIYDENDDLAETRVVKYGDTIGTLIPPEKHGYEFVQWVDMEYNIVDESTKIYSDISIRPTYSLVTYNITYDLQGGVETTNPLTYTYESSKITLKKPTKENFSFVGWTGSNGTTPQKEVTIKNHSYGDKNYVANWIPLSYVAEMNGKYYESIKDAIDDSPDNVETLITVIRDVTEQIKIPANKNFIIDATGYTVSNPCESNTCSTIINNGIIKLTGGTFTCSATAAALNNYNVATIDGATLNGTGLRQALYNEGIAVIKGDSVLTAVTTARGAVQNQASGVMTIEGGTIINKKYYGVANTGTLMVGKHDGTINDSSPEIIGTIGINSSKVISFYDGIIKGKNDAMNKNDDSLIGSREDHSCIKHGTDVIDNVTYKTLSLGRTITVTFDPNGGTVDIPSIEIAEGATIDDFPTVTKDGQYHIGWYTDLIAGDLVTFDYIFNDDITLHARWSDIDPFPIIYEQDGMCTFNGKGNNITGLECSNYHDTDYIDTNVYLFNSENINKDFEITIDVDDFNYDNQVSKSSIISTKDEIGTSEFKYGFVIRYENQLVLLYSGDAEKNIKSNDTITELHKIKIMRISGKLYYSFNDGPLTYLADTNTTYTYDVPVTIGAAIDGTGQPFRVIIGSLSNIKIKLGKFYN